MDDIAKVMKRITVSYVFYFNKKYKRVGHLLQDRFRSEVVENESYFLPLARYIHQNPVKAGMVNSAGQYRWSSYNGYLETRDCYNNIIDKNLILGLFSDDMQTAKRLYTEYMNIKSEDNYLDLAETVDLDGDRAKRIMSGIMENKKVNSVGDRLSDELIIELKAVTGLSIREIAAVTGLNKNRICRILKKTN